MLRKGDTLIEVTLAVGIFSMVAVSIVAVLSSNTSDAQTALETTLAREEVDAQAEALRFIQSAYIADRGNTSDSPYVDLWHKITQKAVNFNNPDKDATVEEYANYSPASCAELYGNGQATQKGFIINPRDLSSGEKAIIPNDYSSGILTEATTYPRLIYKGDTSKLADDNSNNTIEKAEGIYIIAIKDANSTKIDGKQTSAFYDFYIRTCWYASNSDRPVTVSTVIRLYDPDAIGEEKN